MGKKGIDIKGWNEVVTDAHRKTEKTKTITVKVTKTSLTRLKKIEELQDKAKQILTSYKAYKTDRIKAMKAVGEKIVADDKTFAGKINQNSTRIIFK